MTEIPPDRIFSDLMTKQIETLKQGYSKAASEDGLTVEFTVSPQGTASPQGKPLFTLTIHYSVKPTAADASAASANPPAAQTDARGAGQPLNFATGGRALSRAEFDQAIVELDGVEPQMLWALIKKESETLTGFLGDRRPVILYERHVFSRQSGHRFDKPHPEISGPPYGKGNYGTLSQQYDKLSQAMSLDRIAALKACSWGIGQTLGEGAVDIGYPSVETLVSQMIQSEGLQLHAIVAEIKQKDVVNDFLNKDHSKFAVAYNGDKTGTYASELQQDYHFFIIKGLPDLTVRTAQLYLTYLGNFSHPVDGVLGDWTRQSLLKFQSQANLTASGQPDPPTIAELERRLFAVPSSLVVKATAPQEVKVAAGTRTVRSPRASRPSGSSAT